MDLSTTYLGLSLPHPLMPGASPMVDDLGTVKRLEDAGAAAIVMHSLFEEQIVGERESTDHYVESTAHGSAEAASLFPAPSEYRLGPSAYLEQVRKIKEAVAIPVIGSLNGTTATGWLEYAHMIEQAGADALELNVYYVATNPKESSLAVERRTIDMVRAVKTSVKIPVAVKLSPYFSSLSHFAADLEMAGADGVVLFNRFYQPDIDPLALEVRPELHLSDSSELLLRLRWLAILSGQRKLDLACSGGVHGATEAVKAVMAGAAAVQLVSALLRHGPKFLRQVHTELEKWMEDNEYSSLAQMRGSMNLARCPDPAAFERGNYVRMLQTWRP